MSISSVNGIKEGENTTAENKICQCDSLHSHGIIRVIGIGPGEELQMTPQAVNALNDSDIIVGYNTYIALIKDLIMIKKLLVMACVRK